MRAVVTVFGKDKVGIIAEVSAMLAKNNVNILDVSQTLMAENFTMMMMVELNEAEADFAALKHKLEDLGKRTGLSIRIQREDIFQEMHQL